MNSMDRSSSAFCSGLKISPRKLSLVADLCVKKKTSEILVQLPFLSRGRSAAKMIHKVLTSAVYNAKNNFGLDVDNLVLQSIIVGKDRTVRRIRPRARGRAFKIKKHYSNLKIILKDIGYGSKD